MSVVCDIPSCQNIFGPEPGIGTFALRAHARAAGWASQNDSQKCRRTDYCPSHAALLRLPRSKAQGPVVEAGGAPSRTGQHDPQDPGIPAQVGHGATSGLLGHRESQ